MFVSPIGKVSPNFGMAHRPQGLIDAMSGITRGKKLGELTQRLGEQSRVLDKQKRHITSAIVEETTKRGKPAYKIVGTITDFSDNPAGNDIVRKFNPKNPTRGLTSYLNRIDNNIYAVEQSQLGEIGNVAKTLKNSIISRPRRAPEEVSTKIAQNTKEAVTAAFKKLFGEQTT